MHVPEKAPSLFCPSCLLHPLPLCCPFPPSSPSLLVKVAVQPPRLWPSPAPATPPSGNLRGLQALKWPPSPFSVSTVCCLTNSSSRKGEFIEEKDQSFCWKMLFPVLVSHFLTLSFHTQGQHILGELCRNCPGSASPVLYLPKFFPEPEAGARVGNTLFPLSRRGNRGQGRAVTFLRSQLREQQSPACTQAPGLVSPFSCPPGDAVFAAPPALHAHTAIPFCCLPTPQSEHTRAHCPLLQLRH